MPGTAWSLAGLSREAWRALPLDVRIHLAAAPYLGWRYDLTRPRLAYCSPSVPESLVGGKRVTNCSTLTSSVLTASFPTNPWTLREYGDLQVFADRLLDNPDSPIQAVERVGVGSRVSDFVEGLWHLVQGLRSKEPYRGHAILVRAFADGNLRVLEASSREGGIGPRWRWTDRAGLDVDFPADMFIAALGPG